MKVFKYLLATAAVILSAAACDKTNTLPTKPEMSSEVTEIVFPKEGGSRTFKIKANREFTTKLQKEADADWCLVSVKRGKDGGADITVQAEALDGDFRKTVLMLNASAAVSDIVIMQTGVPAVTTVAVTHVSEASATVGIEWAYSGEISVSEAGVRVSSGSSTVDYPVSEALEPGQYTLDIEGLSAETDYTAQAYLNTADGEAFLGEALAFRTDKAPVTVPVSSLLDLATSGSVTISDNLIIKGVVSTIFPLVATKSADVTTARYIIQDGIAAHSAICVYDDTDVKVGDELSVRIKEATVEKSGSGGLVLRDIKGSVTVVSSANSIAPVSINHEALADYENMYVRIESTQLLNIFTNSVNYPTWGSAAKFTLEVEGSTVSYDIFVPETSELYGAAPGTGSGYTSGIVLADGGDVTVMVTSPSDISLTGARFESLLDLTFQKPVFYGDMTVGEEISGCRLEIPYKNGDNSVISGEISVSVSGPAAEGITVASLTDATIPAGNGSLKFTVSGTPVTAGEVIFTVSGIDALADASCTATVGAPFTPTVGNFNVYWTPTAASVPKSAIPSSLTYDENTSADITVSTLNLVASEANKSGTKWSGDWGAIGWDLNLGGTDVQYYECSLSVAAGKTLSISGIDFAFRVASGTPDVSFKYSIDGGEFVEFYSCATSDVTAATIPAGKNPVLKAIAGGSTVTIRVVPSCSASGAKMGLSKDKKFAIYGNVE